MARILVVDDDPSVRLAVRAALEAEGHDVSEAENGYRAEDAHKSRSLDVILLDMHMPVRNGIETLRSLRRAGQEPKIVMMGGECRLCQTDFLPMARRLGADATLDKPVSVELLQRVVADLLAP